MEHPEWANADGACVPCLSAYRKLLEDRLTPGERLHTQAEDHRLWPRVERFLARSIGMAKRISHAPSIVAKEVRIDEHKRPSNNQNHQAGTAVYNKT